MAFSKQEEQLHTRRQKTFIESQRTLWGNFYPTAILNGNRGADAEFGGAMGDGDIYIPCFLNEGSSGSKMKLIVRVLDHGRGKKYLNLGEIILDAKRLASDPHGSTYNLTRDGKPEKGTVTLAATFVPTSTITPISGGRTAQSQETLILKVLRANELRKAPGIVKNVYVQVWRAPNNLATPPKAKKLPEPDMKIKLPKQAMTFKFAFPTRVDSPGSVVMKFKDHASIAYYIKAEMDRKGRRNLSLKYPITIIPLRPVPMPHLLSACRVESEDQIKAKQFCRFAYGKAGVVTMKLDCSRCQKETTEKPVNETGLARLVVVEQSHLDKEVATALEEPRFVAAMMKFYGTK